jgi:sugar O-acyltransferase (sialic acid O-acetyltransferase NeuD family)
MRNIVIIGSSGHAKVVIDLVEKEGKCRIAGLLDQSREIDAETLGYRVLGKEEDLRRLLAGHALAGAIVAIGDNFVRSQVAARVRQACPGLAFVTAVHPGAHVARGVAIGEGTVLMAGATVNPCCSIGSHCILNTNSSLDHDSVMGDFSSLAPRAAAGGDVSIGAFTAIGIGATVIHGVRIGEHTVIGAGSTVLEGVGSRQVAFGTPARVIRERRCGDRYL